MIEKKIKALRDFQFTNFSGTHYFTENEVKVLQFISQRVFEQHLQAGWMVEADPNEPEGKPIAVVYPPKTEDTIVSVSPVDPIDLELGSVEPDKPDLPCPPEDHINEIEALDVSKDVGKLPDDVPEDLVHSELSIEEVVPEREEEDQHPKFEDEAGEPEEVVTLEDEKRSEPHPEEIEEVPVEEISIEEQNENTLEPGEVVE